MLFKLSRGVIALCSLTVACAAVEHSTSAVGAPQQKAAVPEATSVKQLPALPPLADGVYAVTGDESTAEALEPSAPGTRIVRYRNRFIEQTAEEPRFLAIVTGSGVPLTLQLPPEAMKAGDGRTYLQVTLRSEHIKGLEELTRAQLNSKVAMVLDGEVITVHKVRAVITDGKVMITRCSDNACELIRSRLMD